MKKIFFPLFIFVGTLCFGQDYLPVFADKDSVRYQIRHKHVSILGNGYEIWTEKETIDSRVYDHDSTEYKIFKFINKANQKDSLLVREDTLEKKIYAKGTNDDWDHLIYDFSLPVDSFWSVLGYRFGEFNSPTLLTVKDEWIENYAGLDRKVQLIEVNNIESSIIEIEIIEGIGTKKGFSYFFDFLWPFDGLIEELACVSHDGELIYTIGDCYLDTMVRFSNIQNIDFKNDVFIYPNPVIDEITIQGKQPFKTNSFLKIFTLQGVLVRKEELQSQSNIQSVNLNGLSSGLYFYQIVEEGRVIQSDKLTLIK